MGTSREKREEAHTHTHTHTFPSSLCSQSKTQETLFLLYIFYALSYICTYEVRVVLKSKQTKHIFFKFVKTFLLFNLSLSFFLIDGLYYIACIIHRAS